MLWNVSLLEFCIDQLPLTVLSFTTAEKCLFHQFLFLLWYVVDIHLIILSFSSHILWLTGSNSTSYLAKAEFSKQLIIGLFTTFQCSLMNLEAYFTYSWTHDESSWWFWTKLNTFSMYCLSLPNTIFWLFFGLEMNALRKLKYVKELISATCNEFTVPEERSWSCLAYGKILK